MKTTRTIKYCNVTVRRPGGEVETVRHRKIYEMTPEIWAQLCDAMTRHGKGEALSYENCSEEEPLTLEEQREELAFAISAALDRADDESRHAHASSYAGPSLYEAADAVKQAEAALASFDAEHPEIIDAIEAQRAKKFDQHMFD